MVKTSSPLYQMILAVFKNTVNFTMLIQLLLDVWFFRMDDLDVHAGSSDEDMVQNVKTRAHRKKVCSVL